MKAILKKKLLLKSAGFFILLILFPGSAIADIRTDYLLSMLKDGGSYRVKVQAANSLGEMRCKEATGALVKALYDENELVIISAAQALGRIGDTSVKKHILLVLKNANPDGPVTPAAKTQLEKTLRILNSLENTGSKKQEKSQPLFLIKVDKMGNSSKSSDPKIKSVLRDEVINYIKNKSFIIYQDSKMNAKAVRKKLKKLNLKGYILSGSIIKLEHQGNKIIVKISLNVFSNPDYNLLMMPSAQAEINVPKAKPGSLVIDNAHKRAIKILVSNLLGKILK